MIGGLWRGHPSNRKRTMQADFLLSMLRTARKNREGVPLPQIMVAGIAQHGARLNELRSFVIQNQLPRDNSGVVCSKYWLKYDPEKEGGDEK